MQKIFYSVIIILFFYLTIPAQTIYYVSSSGGNDFNSGKSSSTPWKTLSKLNSTTFKAGDKILLKKGDVWREQLNILTSGSSVSPIEVNSYDTGKSPIISGANLLTGFVQHSGNIWKKYITLPQQVFFNGVRGNQTSLSNVNSSGKWHWSSNYLYVYSSGNPSIVYTSPGVEYTSRKNGIYVKGSYISINNLQIEKLSSSGIEITSSSNGTVINNVQFYQWSAAINGAIGAVNVNGNYSTIKNSSFGKKTGNDISDQGWAGFAGIIVSGKGNTIDKNNIYHSAIENESKDGFYAYGIRVLNASGVTRISNNYIYHTGSHGVYVSANSRLGDQIHINNNKIEYPGQAGISLYKTRCDDILGGKGYVYGNNISFANRLGGDTGGNGSQASGIHFNNGVKAGLELLKPFMKWYCYENIVHNSQALKVPNSPDSGGISVDFNADNVEVYKNLIYNNYGKGIYIWNANKCKIYYNIIYGNDAGTTVSALRGDVETADNNIIYNNTYYKNYNGDAKGPNINAEIFFGFNGDKNIIKNNILYSSSYGYSFFYNITNTSGHILDNNLIYSERSIVARDGQFGEQTLAQWKANHSSWDRNSVGANPQFNNTSDFSLKSTSPAINKGAVLDLLNDFLGNVLNGLPDIGAVEFNGLSNDNSDGLPIVINAETGILANGTALKTQSGSKGTKVAYCTSTSSAISFNVNIPSSGTWYAWGRLYYASSKTQNSFTIRIDNGTNLILGNDDGKFNQWHWDGYKSAKINLGSVSAGNHTITIIGREPSETVMLDQVLLTNDPNYIPSNSSPGGQNIDGDNIVLSGENALLSGDAKFGYKTGAKSAKCLYFNSLESAAKFTVTIPNSGNWYAWGRVYYSSAATQNSFFIRPNNDSRRVLGNDDHKFDQWYWAGYLEKRINLGTLEAGINTITITAREPGVTLWVDQIILTMDTNYDPNKSLGKENSEDQENNSEELNNVPVSFEISQNYPNPFNPSTKIKYAVPDNSHVSLKVFDILGAEVASLVDEVKSPGYYEIVFDGSYLSSGIYIYQLRTRDFVQSRKMSLVK